MNRRTFFKKSATAAAVVAASPSVLAASPDISTEFTSRIVDDRWLITTRLSHYATPDYMRALDRVLNSNANPA